MLFNTFEFLLLFLPAVLLAFNAAKQRGPAPAQLVLLAASIGFYTWWDFRLTPLLLASLGFNYGFGRWLACRPTISRLWPGVLANLAPLVWFNYLPWVAPSTRGGISALVLPLGISFFTFLQIAYLTSIHRRDHRDDGFVPYAVFVTYFPHLIAGPILKLREFAPQLLAIDRRPLQLDERFARGLVLIVLGLFKKVVIADAWCSGIAQRVFDYPHGLTAAEAWTGALAYTCQLFADFSGYCEMAIGMSLLMGITIPVNFLSP
jgi:alginate O-acetyltransferase complex protein AlgI